MKRTLLLLALALSVLFNVFFAAGYLKAKSQATIIDEEEGAVTARVVEELKLDNAQAELFTDLRTGMTEDDSVFRQSAALVQQELVEELRRSEPDIERLRGIVARRAELQYERQIAAAERLSEFFHVLSPEQQRHLLRRLYFQQREAERLRRLVERFDADADGELNETEREAARVFLEERHREREQQRLEHRERRERMIKRFDADGDGTLNEAERDEMRRWWKESGEGRDWDGRDRGRYPRDHDGDGDHRRGDDDRWRGGDDRWRGGDGRGRDDGDDRRHGDERPHDSEPSLDTPTPPGA